VIWRGFCFVGRARAPLPGPVPAAQTQGQRSSRRAAFSCSGLCARLCIWLIKDHRSNRIRSEKQSVWLERACMDSSLVHSLMVFFFLILIPYVSGRWVYASLRTVLGIAGIFTGGVFLIFTSYRWLVQETSLFDASMRGGGQALILACLFLLHVWVTKNK